MTWHTDPPPANDVYYRILIKDDETWHVCTVQWFDECDYDQSKWLHYNGDPVWFKTEAQAERFCEDRRPQKVNRNIRKL